MNSHTVSWECINCYPLATSEQTQAHSHTLEWLLQGHLLLLTPSFLGLSLFFSPAVFFTFAPLCTTTAYQLIHSQRDTHTHMHMMSTKHRLLLMSGQGHSQADSPRIELSSVSPQACVCVCICVCFYVVRVSVTLGWECSVGGYCQHAQAGVYWQRHRTLIWSSSQTQREHD